MQVDVESLLSLPWQEALEMPADVIMYDESSFFPVMVKVPWDAKCAPSVKVCYSCFRKYNLQKSVELMQCRGSQ